MNVEYTKIQEARILAVLMKCASKDGEIVIEDECVNTGLRDIISNWNIFGYYMYELDQGGVLYYEEIGEDGFKPIVMCRISERTYEYHEGLLFQINTQLESMQVKLDNILTFNPDRLGNEIAETELKLTKVKESISGNEYLAPLEKPFDQISSHFSSLKVVSDSYEEIYKNIVRPVQDEGRKGVRTTVRWAIGSVIVSVALSWVVSNWDSITKILAST